MKTLTNTKSDATGPTFTNSAQTKNCHATARLILLCWR